MAYTSSMIGTCIHLKTVDSTNAWARRNISSLQPFTYIVAQTQSAGQGQYSRPWLSQQGDLTMTLCFPAPERKQELLGQCFALNVMQVLSSVPLKFKWPNDLFTSKKLGGILTEIVSYKKTPWVLLGCGLNLTKNSPPQTDSLAKYSLPWNYLTLAEKLVQGWVPILKSLPQGGFLQYRSILNQALLYKGSPVSLKTTNQIFTGILKEIAPSGALVLEIDGLQQHFFSGTLRPMCEG